VLLLLQRGGEIDHFVNTYTESYLKTKNAISSLIWTARNFDRGAELGLKLASRGLRDIPEDPDLRDCAGILAVISGGRLLDEAITQGELAIAEGSDRPATRNWLAQALLKRGGIGASEQAINHLITNNQKFGNEDSRKLLSLIRSNRFEDVIADVSPKNRKVEVSRITGVGDEHKTDFSNSALSQFPLPEELSDLGTLRRISILLSDDPTSLRHLWAREELEKKWRAGSQFRQSRDYIALLRARIDLAGSYEDELPSFAARFEYALNREDRMLLERISDEYPRLTALTLIARAMFGDFDAAREVITYLSTKVSVPAHQSFFREELLRRTFGSEERIVQDTVAVVHVLQTRRARVEPLIRQANEALVYLAA
jgi:hypothetical protein